MNDANKLAVVNRTGSLADRRSKACLARPSQSSREAHIQVTKETIDRLIEAAEKQQETPKPSNNQTLTSSYIPKGSAHQHSLEVEQQQVDPLEPPRHRYRKERPFEDGKLVLATLETKAPIMRPPPAKLSAAEKDHWKIPSSVSNWKNGRGFMIDLDVRSAATNAPKASNDQKHAELGRALMEAEQDLKRERNEEVAKLRHQRELRNRLLEQKGRKRLREEHESEEVFDSRLYNAGSKARQALYDESMFSRKKTHRRPPKSLEFQE